MKYATMNRGTVYHIMSRLDNVGNYMGDTMCGRGTWNHFGDKLHENPPKDMKLCKHCEKCLESQFVKKI